LNTVKLILASVLSAYCQVSKWNSDKTGYAVDDTQNLKLPYILAAQAQKHVTHNEALRALDSIVQLAVLDRDLTTPPTSPMDGDRFIVATGGAGDWVGKDGQIAAWQDGAWAFYQPNKGWLAWVGDEDVLCVNDGTAWSVASSGGGTNPVPLVGINATADTTNRLSVSSAASLFNHSGSDHQQKINKATSADTASQLYQTNFSGRAEVGLTGDDDFHFKVSPDGTSFHEAIIIDKDDGSVQFPNSAFCTVRVQTFESGSGTYTVPSGVKALKVTCVGAGGGGAGAETTSTAHFVGAGGGGGAGTVIKWIAIDALAASYSYVVGAGGAGGSASPGSAVGSRDGGNGGDTTFASGALSLTAGGGSGAPEDTPGTGANEFLGGAGGTSSGGGSNISGSRGSGGVTHGSTFYQIGLGYGGASLMGVGGTFKNGTGNPGSGFGAGGAGCGMLPGYLLNRTGGAGSGGIIIVEEFY